MPSFIVMSQLRFGNLLGYSAIGPFGRRACSFNTLNSTFVSINYHNPSRLYTRIAVPLMPRDFCPLVFAPLFPQRHSQHHSRELPRVVERQQLPTVARTSVMCSIQSGGLMCKYVFLWAADFKPCN